MGEESGIQTKILNDLRYFGKYCIVTKIMKASDNAFPDIYFSMALVGSVWIETKRPKGVEAKLQTARIEKLNACGTKAYVCYSWDQWYNLKRELGLLDVAGVLKAHELRERMLST